MPQVTLTSSARQLREDTQPLAIVAPGRRQSSTLSHDCVIASRVTMRWPEPLDVVAK